MIDSLLRKHLEGSKAGTILDVGPGFSHFARLVAQLTGARQIAYMDCNPEVLSWQKAECDKVGLATALHQVDLSEEGLASLDCTFDIILCQEVLEHLQTPTKIMEAVQDHLNAGGRLVVTVPTKMSERWLKRINAAYMRNIPFGHIQEFSEDDLQRLIAGAGLSVRVLIPAQPHFFISHTWVYGSRMRVNGSTGSILDKGLRYFVGNILFSLTKKLIKLTGGMEVWAKFLPRNYFLIAEKK